MEAASQAGWGRPARTYGEGGSIPFMAMLGSMFPDAQFFVTGVMGPGSNAHGPNEFIDVPYATALTGAVADVVAAHAIRPR
jgi:acetylornithine deacetylase/succinyl-diaminopimelate desuccinylase-like protein